MDIVRELSMNPAVQAVAIKLITDVVKGQLKNLDNQHVAAHFGKILQITLAVLSGLTAFVTKVSAGHAGDFDPGPIVQYAMTLYVSALTIHQGTEAAKVVMKPKTK